MPDRYPNNPSTANGTLRGPDAAPFPVPAIVRGLRVNQLFPPAPQTPSFDVHLNDNARWSNVPAAVWNYKLGGYQVLKKWLSYRESKVLGRNLLPEEVQHFTDTARRIAAVLGLTGEVERRWGG